ncbi:MAG: RecQ family ATP-dependent DNA helicase, partial [Cyclobacteriaceae bacterium]
TEHCAYCNESLDIANALSRYFGYNLFRTYEDVPLQEKAVQSAVNGESLIAVFPTGGGKSLTFQLPALIAGETSKGLTIIISPLQSLMKDQVDNLEKRGITEAATINGLLDPIARSKAFERIETGTASLLYISPESLRSRSIERLVSGRAIVRFVIDEAHCFSSWGHDFRVDYLYIGDFIKNLQEKKGMKKAIPVSCFTATARKKVIADIRSYFKEKLSLEMKIFKSGATRTNLHYKVFSGSDNDEKYHKVRELLAMHDCPTIIYVSRTSHTIKLAEKLSMDGYPAVPFHGKLSSEEKTSNQNRFIKGEIDIVVATSAFGMGVDKGDVGVVIHFEISNSLENYVQEAGRAGRDADLVADCYILFNEEDLNKHFLLHNQTKLSHKEIQQVWRAVKEFTKQRDSASQSALEIARKAGWDDQVPEIETRVTTAIATLEEAGYLKRKQNLPQVFASSIRTKTADEAIKKINNSKLFDATQRQDAIRIIKRLFSAKSAKGHDDEEAESRVDYLSDRLSINKKDVIKAISLMREEHILEDQKDLSAFVSRQKNINRSLRLLENFAALENFLADQLDETEKTFHIKELNEAAVGYGLKNSASKQIRTILNYWSIKNHVKRRFHSQSTNHFAAVLQENKQTFKEKRHQRHEIARFILDIMYRKVLDRADNESDHNNSAESLVQFSVGELVKKYGKQEVLFARKTNIEQVEEALFFLSKIEAVKIEGGFMVIYNRLTIDRLEKNNKVQFKQEDYQLLKDHYDTKVKQIHIVGEYAKKMLDKPDSASNYVTDYFQLNLQDFESKYFPGKARQSLKLNMTQGKFNKLFASLSEEQYRIIQDHQSEKIVVLAGPGSGKTRVLVHKLAAILLMEDVKHEQLLMLTFSRSAAMEFKTRLIELVGGIAHRIDIKTFYSYCFDLIDKKGTLEKSADVLQEAVEGIRAKSIEPNKITKSMLVIDEAQDMSSEEFELVKSLMEYNEHMRIIAVGDDDQNIYGFRGSDNRYLRNFAYSDSAIIYELLTNYRSRNNIVAFNNQYLQSIPDRMKSHS